MGKHEVYTNYGANPHGIIDYLRSDGGLLHPIKAHHKYGVKL
jgi:hypothetical protein